MNLLLHIKFLVTKFLTKLSKEARNCMYCFSQLCVINQYWLEYDYQKRIISFINRISFNEMQWTLQIFEAFKVKCPGKYCSIFI